MSDREQRRLVAIVAADVASYSRLIGADEKGTLDALRAHRHELIDPLLTEHVGRIANTAGDSLLLEFLSVVDAVRFSVAMQKGIAARNAKVPPGRRVEYRIGINVGDVVTEGDDLLGDGVNVAARLEAIADPGGVCLSGKVYEEVKRKLDLSFVASGAQQLKGIIDPVPVYHLRGQGGGTALPTAGQAAMGEAHSADALPTVAVSSLKVISGDDEVRSLVEGLREDIIGGLAKMNTISVLGGEGGATPGSDDGADFRLEGSARAAGRRLRLSFTLFEAASHSQAWSERYDRELDDILDLEDEISENVVTAVWMRLKTRAFERLRGSENAALSVPDLLSKAAGHMIQSQGNNQEVVDILSLALDRKPNSAMALAMMGLCRYRMLEFSSLDPNDDIKDEVLGYPEKAISLDPASYFAHLMAAVSYQDLRGDYETALTHAETALELNSSYALARAMIGICKCHMGEIERGIEMLQRTIEASQEDTQRSRHFRELAIAHFMVGQDAQALRVANRLVRQAPELARNRLVLASLSWHAGKADAARNCVAGLLRDQPDLNLRNMRLIRFTDPDMAARYAQGLRGAGLPDPA
jgi:adenylate cyclase